MMNGQAKEADRMRMERLAKATGKSKWDLQDDLDTRDYRPTKQAKLWSENSGQHYPGFADRPSVAPKPVKVSVALPKRVDGGRKVISDDKYRAELDAQRKRAQALAYLEQDDDGVPDDCLRGDAARKRARDRKSELAARSDNTLKLVGDQAADAKYRELQSKLLSVQSQLRAANGSFDALRSGTLPAAPATMAAAPQAPLVLSAPLPPGWTAHTHAASRQIYYLKAGSDVKRWEPPTSADAAGDGATKRPAPKPAAPLAYHPTMAAAERKKQERNKHMVDPLDPGGRKTGKWSDGMHHKGERMADSTASGPLWQQRPYPAPGKVLGMKGPGVREGSSAGPAPRPKAPAPPGGGISFVPAQARRRPPPPPPPPPPPRASATRSTTSGWRRSTARRPRRSSTS